jgi:hypothetical protein
MDRGGGNGPYILELLFRVHRIDVLWDVFVGKDCEVSGTEPWRIDFEDGTSQSGFMEASPEMNPGPLGRRRGWIGPAISKLYKKKGEGF